MSISEHCSRESFTQPKLQEERTGSVRVCFLMRTGTWWHALAVSGMEVLLSQLSDTGGKLSGACCWPADFIPAPSLTPEFQAVCPPGTQVAHLPEVVQGVRTVLGAKMKSIVGVVGNIGTCQH